MSGACLVGSHGLEDGRDARAHHRGSAPARAEHRLHSREEVSRLEIEVLAHRHRLDRAQLERLAQELMALDTILPCLRERLEQVRHGCGKQVRSQVRKFMIKFEELRQVMRRVVYETICELGLDLDGG